MRIVGFSSGATGKTGNVDRMVQAVMNQTEWDSEFVKLTDLSFGGCRGCVSQCAPVNVCTLDDDLLPHYERVKEADAVVLGSPVYFGSINATIRAFVERFYGYRHVSVSISGKPFVLVVSGCAPPGEAEEEFKQALMPFNVNVVATVNFCSLSPPCFTCGRHKTCNIGGLYHMYGEDAHCMEITPEMYKVWEDDGATVDALRNAAEELKVFEE